MAIALTLLVGIESGIRRIIAQGVACVKDSGMDVTRAMIPEAAVLADPETATFMEHISLWCGPSTTIVAMAVWRGELRQSHSILELSLNFNRA